MSGSSSLPSEEKVGGSQTLEQAFGYEKLNPNTSINFDTVNINKSLKCAICVVYGGSNSNCDWERAVAVGRFVSANTISKGNKALWHPRFFLNSIKAYLLYDSKTLEVLSYSLLPKNVGPDLTSACNKFGKDCNELQKEDIVNLASAIWSGNLTDNTKIQIIVEKKIATLCDLL